MAGLSERNALSPGRGAGSGGMSYKLTEISETLEKLRWRAKAMDAELHRDREAIRGLDQEIQALESRRSAAQRSLAGAEAKRGELAEAVERTEAAYEKLVETSSTLVANLRKDAGHFLPPASQPLTPSRLRVPFDAGQQ